ncbi:hypothetical protein CPT_Percy7 [Caulobacter phage Percy]|uniref:Uncharacterized protein n=1 Tax=Caulobacter phage Percy TaxID=1701809 RepID=A0A0M4QVW6_9CAUD|nr:hypothetical protein CPT_Percy7 [Caulobacter phage Percy]ALF01641.1 hypothetical protein CPT_Percy7 [Caulobacter phage Percy]
MQIITTEAIKAAARAGYLEGTLTAQMKGPCCRNYAEEGGVVYHCAVAQALPLAFNKMHPTDTVSFNRFALEEFGYLYEDIEQAQRLQAAHDSWANAAKYSDTLAKEYREKFLDDIDMPEDQR